MNVGSVDIVEMLEEEVSLGLTFATNLFIGFEPKKPDNTVTLFDTGGFGPQLTFNRDEKYDYVNVQIRVRNNKYDEGWDMINNIKNALHGRAHETWNDAYYSLIHCSSDIAFLDWDENRRARFVVNFELQRRPSPYIYVLTDDQGNLITDDSGAYITNDGGKLITE